MMRRLANGRGVGLQLCLVWCLLGALGCEREEEAVSKRSESSGTEVESSVEAVEEPKPAPRELFWRRHDRAVELMDRVVEAVKEGYEEGTFPGGTGVGWRSVDRVPAEGEEYELKGSGDAGSAEGNPFVALGIEAGTKLPVQLIYRTGEQSGEAATATVTAIADFQPDAGANHTIEQELSVDAKTGEVNVFPRLVHDRWK